MGQDVVRGALRVFNIVIKSKIVCINYLSLLIAALDSSISSITEKGLKTIKPTNVYNKTDLVISSKSHLSGSSALGLSEERREEDNDCYRRDEVNIFVLTLKPDKCHRFPAAAGRQFHELCNTDRESHQCLPCH